MALIETERLQMRRLTRDDADLLLAVWNDPTFIRFVGDRGIRTITEAVAGFEEGPLKLYEEYGYGPFRVALKASDTPIGICGLFRRDWLDEPDIGFGLLPEFCGHGYGFESAEAVVKHARSELRLPRLAAIVSPDNKASIALLEKLGLQFERMATTGEDEHEVRVYAIQLED